MIYFILGAQPELSKAEIQSVLGPELSVSYQSDAVLITDMESRNLNALQERLAGVVKIGHIIGETQTWDKNVLAELIATYASCAMGKNKISFGISVYDLGGGKQTREIEQEIMPLGSSIKRILKETGRPVRHVTSKEPRLSSAVVETNDILGSGGEYTIFVSPDSILIGQTEAVQNFHAWSDRDYGRPARDKHSGMLPPKLARMMINLTGIDPQGHTLLDPFCGSGTVLMEAQLLGFDHLIGSDISEKAVADTKINLQWVTKRFDCAVPTLDLIVSPAASLSQQITQTIDVLVTEVFLGQPRVRAMDLHEAHQIEKQLMPMYEESLNGLRSLIKTNTKVVVAFPAFKQKDGSWYQLPLKPMLEQLGFRVTGNYLYFRPDQFVARDIYIF